MLRQLQQRPRNIGLLYYEDSQYILGPLYETDPQTADVGADLPSFLRQYSLAWKKLTLLTVIGTSIYTKEPTNNN